MGIARPPALLHVLHRDSINIIPVEVGISYFDACNSLIPMDVRFNDSRYYLCRLFFCGTVIFIDILFILHFSCTRVLTFNSGQQYFSFVSTLCQFDTFECSVTSAPGSLPRVFPYHNIGSCCAGSYVLDHRAAGSRRALSALLAGFFYIQLREAHDAMYKRRKIAENVDVYFTLRRVFGKTSFR